MTISFPEILNDAVQGETLLKAVMSRPRKSAILPFRKVVVRPIRVKEELCYQFSMREQSRETHENLSPDETADRIREWCGATFSDCHLFTPSDEFSIRFRHGGNMRIKRKPIHGPHAQRAEHNRVKPYLIPDGTPCPFLIETGVMTSGGKVRAAKYHKFRQINRFLELVDDVVSSLPETGRLTVIDFGCGKSFLTFAVHFLLSEIHQRDVRIVGLDRNADVVAQCATLVEKLRIDGLTFQQQEIAEFPGVEQGERVDMVVSLHACDTATDDTLAQALKWNARVILAVPCCQHEVAGTMTGDELRGIARYGILQQRFAAIATDALRAEILEQQGYRTQVVEFIDLEHTAKNVLIRAVRRNDTEPSSDRSLEVRQLKELLGISRLHLEDALKTGDP